MAGTVVQDQLSSTSPRDQASILVNEATSRIVSTGYDYDEAGNMLTTGGGLVLTWDSLGSLAKKVDGATEEYVYAPGGERIAIFRSGSSLRTLRGPGNLVLRELTGTGTIGSETLTWSRDYIYRGSQLLATETTAGRQHFHLDHLGSPRLITNANGERVAFHTYYPFGQEATPIQDLVRMKFTGHERDEQGGSGVNDLDYMHARYYSPVVGRFLSVDSGRDWDVSQPQSWNLFSYVRNNPVNNTDPDGRFCIPCIPIVVKAGVVAVEAGAVAYVFLSNPANVQRSIALEYRGQSYGCRLRV